MANPGRVKNYGNLAASSGAKNVFRVIFNQALSTAAKYEAWDNAQAFPAVDTAGSTVSGYLFIGTAGNGNLPCLSLADCTSSILAYPWDTTISGAVTAGAANPNRLFGTSSYVQTSGGITAQSGFLNWNVVANVPYDFEPAYDMDHLLQIRYTYTGTAPALEWQFNDCSGATGGTEATPSWTIMSAACTGVRHGRTGAATPNWYANIPASGVEQTTEGWITS